jgi:hypothetical protein
MVTGMLWSKTSGMVGSEARGSSNTALFSSTHLAALTPLRNDSQIAGDVIDRGR